MKTIIAQFGVPIGTLSSAGAISVVFLLIGNRSAVENRAKLRLSEENTRSRLLPKDRKKKKTSRK